VIKELWIENFKAIGAQQKIPLAPITLIFGPNNSGKSSIMQSLLVMKQTLELGRSALFTQGDMVDVGMFRDFVHMHEESRTVKLGLVSDGSVFPSKESLPAQGLLYEFILNSINKEDELSALSVLANKGQGITKPALKFEPRRKNDPSFGQKDKVLRLTEVGPFPLGMLDADAAILHLFAQVRDWIKSYTGNELGLVGWADDIPEGDNLADPLNFEWLKRERNIQPGEHLDRLEAEIQKSVRGKADPKEVLYALAAIKAGREWIEKDEAPLADVLEILREFLCVTVRNLRVGRLGNVPKMGDGLSSDWWGEMSSKHQLDKDQASLDPRRTAKLVERELRNIRHIQALRSSPDRYYLDKDYKPVDVGRAGEDAALLLSKDGNSKLRRQVSLWLSHLVDTKLDLRSRSLEGVFKLVLKSEELEVSVADVGFGIGQVFPIIAQAIIPKPGTLCIEQPEAQLHPKMQARLGDLFLHAALGKERAKKQLVIETHSEHLLFRMLRRIRETTNGFGGKTIDEGLPFTKVSPEDICILYVERRASNEPGETGSVVRRLHVSQDGDLLDPFPDGDFFQSDLKDRMAGWVAEE